MTIPKLNISWTLIEGDKRGGFSIFWADDGLDTGPILLQRDCYVGENDTVDSIYNGFMYPEGIKVIMRCFSSNSGAEVIFGFLPTPRVFSPWELQS